MYKIKSIKLISTVYREYDICTWITKKKSRRLRHKVVNFAKIDDPFKGNVQCFSASLCSLVIVHCTAVCR